MSKKKILIVGGTGFIGYHLGKKCLSRKWTVVSISTRKPSSSRFLKGVKYLIADISNKNELKKKIKDNFDYVVNFGGHVDHSNKIQTRKTHYIGCKNLVEIFQKLKPDLFIQMGSSAEYGNNQSPLKENFNCKPKSSYGKSKLLSTKYLIKKYKEKKFPAVIIRLFQAYGPKQAINRIIPITINACLKNKRFKCSSGIQTRDFVHIDDLVNAIFLIFKSKKSIGKIINIGSGVPKKIKEIIIFINENIKKGTPLFGTVKMRRDEILHSYANINVAKKILKWKPKINFNKGLLQMISSYAK